MHRPQRFLPLACVALAAGLQSAAAQDDGDASIDRAPERCITLPRLDRTEVIDDRTIIFHMRGGAIFLNHLSRECPGLEREERFMYSPTSTRLCDVDTITVLENRGFGFTRGFTCSLGLFHPITELELVELRDPQERGEDGAGGFEVEQVDPSEIEARDDEPDGDAEAEAEADDERR
ncbi:MAG: hypothetical protein JXB36_17315 [Gammaproteobacteria bacterium]|nr:hypothetical protein [Gammaproteobacteria bacterium]